MASFDDKHAADIAVSDVHSDSPETKLMTPEGEEYLLQRHGTLDLDPMPRPTPDDPLNWPTWYKNLQIMQMAFMGFLATFMAAGISTAYEDMAERYGMTVHEQLYLTSAMILAFGIFPLFWVPVMQCYGRKWFLVIPSFCCFVLNLGAGFAKTYGQQMATRVLVAIFISMGTAAGGGLVRDLCFLKERAFKNGWWLMAFILGTPAGPFFCGFIQYHCGTDWIYWVFAIMNFVQFLMWLPMKETLRTPAPFSVKVFWAPFKQAANINVLMAVIAALITFAYNNVCLVVLKPILMAAFHLNSQLLGLNYLSLIIGLVIGEILAGRVSDWWMQYCIRKRGEKVIVDRLWQGYIGFIVCIVGLFVWGAFLDQAGSTWNVRPLVGDGIAAAGNNIVATVLTSFAIDANPTHALDVALFLNFVRLTWSFLAPFYLPDMFERLKYLGLAGLMNGLVLVFGAGCTAVAHWLGRHKAVAVEKV